MATTGLVFGFWFPVVMFIFCSILYTLLVMSISYSILVVCHGGPACYWSGSMRLYCSGSIVILLC